MQLKSLLTTFTEKGKIPVLEFLSAAIESAEYERALARGLVSSAIDGTISIRVKLTEIKYHSQTMPECRVVPCYKMFLKELKEIMSSSVFSNTSMQSSHIENFGNVDVEHISLPNKCNFSSVIEAVNKGIQTNFRFEVRKENTIMNSKTLRRQVVRFKQTYC